MGETFNQFYPFQLPCTHYVLPGDYHPAPEQKARDQPSKTKRAQLSEDSDATDDIYGKFLSVLVRNRTIPDI